MLSRLREKFHTFTVNDNEKPGPRGLDRYGSIFWHGRWIARVRDETRRWPELQLSWNHWTNFCHAQLKVNKHDREVSWTVAFPPVAYWVTLEGLPRRWFGWLPWDAHGRTGEYTGDRRAIGVAIHGGAFWWDLWNDEFESRSTDPWWTRGCFHFKDGLLGGTSYSDEILETRDVVIPMPEKAYSATAKLKLSRWRRPLWPWPAEMLRVEIDCPEGIPVPGKGENSWDCGDDATYGITCAAPTIEGAIGQLVASTLRTRQKRSGHHGWDRPAKEDKASEAQPSEQLDQAVELQSPAVRGPHDPADLHE
jgi:hypothetical protein